MKQFIRKYFPKPLQSFLRRIYYKFPITRKLYYFPIDLLNHLRGKGDKLSPPRSKIFVGDGNFEEIGNEFLNYFVDLCYLKPNEKVLEVGCGIGRMAAPLTSYLEEDGHYEGFDIIKEGIDWCQKNITPKYPNFHFQLADVYNNLYHPGGKFKASEYKFPFGDERFDFVFLTSVFTHMLPQELKNYLPEISRVLKKEGRALITFFLLNEESTAYVQGKDSKFSQEYEGCRVIDKNIPEAAIAYKETFVRELFIKNNLEILEPIRYGSWCKRKEFLSSQDIIFAAKK